VNVITMVLFNRPDYTRTVIEAMRRCVGIENCLILPHIEPGCDEVIALAKGIDFAQAEVTVNPKRLGCGLNTFRAWEDGMNRGEFITHIEDDTVPAADCLNFMEHCRDRYEDDHTVFSACAYNRYFCPPENYFKVARRGAYTCWIVGLWKNRWEWIRQNWNPDPNRYATFLCNRTRERQLAEVYPLLSRAQNIGAERGLHVESVEWHRIYHHTEHWAGNFDLKPAAFWE
jgi:hypothetical protein